MMRHLRFLFLSMLALLWANSFAGTIVFADLGLENGVQYSEPFDGGDFTVTFAGGTNDGKYYTTGTGIRVYGNGTMTIAAKSGTLSKVVITFSGSNKPESADVVNVGNYDVETGTWTGDAAQIVFTRPEGSGHWRVQKVSTDEAGNEPEPGGDSEVPVVATCAEIIAAADGTLFQVTGTVKEIKNTQYGNWTLEDATGEVYIYGTRDKEGKTGRNNSIDNWGIQEGDKLTVQGPKTTYGETVELVDVTVISIEKGSGPDNPEPEPEPYTQVGDGSQDNPFTVADLKHMDIPANSNAEEGQEMVWVKGFIAGSLNSAGSAYAEVATNLALAETADEADAAATVPVQLPAGDLRSAVNLVDNPQNKSKEVSVHGYILKYMSKTGVKNIDEVILDGQLLNVDTLKAAAKAKNAPRYNMAGQRVSNPAKGVYIQNGRKQVVK